MLDNKHNWWFKHCVGDICLDANTTGSNNTAMGVEQILIQKVAVIQVWVCKH